MHVRFSQHEVVSENTKTHVFTTSQQTDFTFVRDVGVQLAQVRVSATEFLKFALVELTVPETLSADAVAGIIPASSLRASVGFSLDTTAPPVYPCVDLYAGAGKSQIDGVLAAQADCALQHPVCAPSGPTPVGAGGKVTFMLPLGSGWWTEAELDNAGQALLPEYIFLDFLVNVQDAAGQRSLARMQTRTPVSRLSVASFCEQVQLQDGIAGMLQIDLLLGLAGSDAAYADSVVEYSDVAGGGGTGTLTMARNTSSPAANVVTLLVTGDDALFTQEFAQLYSLVIEDLSSVHMIDAGKKTAVDALLASGNAFRKYEDPQSYSTLRYVPTDALLAQCPVGKIRQVLGCATRRDIRERMPDFTSQSVLEIGPEGPIDEEPTFALAGAWLQRQLGGSDYVYALGQNHSRLVHERYRLDKRYRRGFMLAPTAPWSSAQMQSAGVASVLDLAQHTVFSFMVSLDLNDDVSTIPTVEMDVPSTLAMSADELLGDPALQSAVEASYAEAMGVEADNVVLDESSVQDSGARRRLLAPVACQFSLRVEIVIKNEEEAMQFAENLRMELVKEESPVVASIISNLNTKVRAVKPDMPAIKSKDDFLPDTLVIPPPKKAPGCRNVDWEREVTGLLGLGLAHTDADGNPVTGWVSCSQRYYKLASGDVAQGAGMLMANTSIRGASQAADWQRFYDAGTGSYPHVTDPAQQERHWEWWDMCAEPPVGAFYSGHANEFSRAWEKIQAEARQQCCLCRRQPLVPNSFTEYVHKYSWPLAVDGTSDSFYDVSRESTLLLHTQAGNFANKRSKNFDASGIILPATWSVEPGTGRTVTTACKAGEWERRPGACAACVAGTYRPLETEHTLRTRCLACPTSKSSPPGSIALEACVCGAGFQPDAGDGCNACPANTYKDAPGDWACLACPDGSIASPGATSAAQCVTQEAYVDALGRTRLYTSVLGALMHLNYVEPGWADPAPADQANARMCAVSVDGTALNCPGATHPNAFSVPLVFGAADDTVAQIEYDTDDAFQRNNVLYYHGSASYPCRLVFYLTPEAPHQFAVGGVDRPDLKRQVQKVGLKLRPHYMGPAPPGLTERVLEDGAWGATTVLTTSLRALVPGIDLAAAAPAQVLRVVQFVSTKRLDTTVTSTDWRWVLCGQAAPDHHAHAFVYGKCAAGADPDNAGASNLANEHVLDLRVFELSNTDAAAKSCYYQHWWADGCDAIAGTGMSADAPNMYDGVLRWEPAIPADQRNAEQLWVYTYFMLGDSEACLAHSCDEAAVYAQMPAHVSAAWQSTWDTEVQLMPGTLVTLHEREPVPVHITPVFDTTIGLLRAEDACTVADGGLECADHAQVRAYPGLYAAAVDATTLAAGVQVEPVTSAVPHAPVFEHEGQTVAAVATKMPGLGVAAGQTAQASVYVRKETEVPCADPCGPGTQNGADLYDENAACTPCPANTYKANTGYEPCTPCTGNLVTAAEGSTAVEQCSCGPNTFYQNEQCYACPDGGFKGGYNLEATCGACRANSVSAPDKYELRHCQCDPGYSLEVGAELEAQQSSVLFSGTWYYQPIIFPNLYNAAKSPGGVCDLTEKFYGSESGCFRDTPCWPQCDESGQLPCTNPNNGAAYSCSFVSGWHSYKFKLPFGTDWRTAEPILISAQRNGHATMGIYGDINNYGQTWGQSETTCAIECRHCTQAQVDSGACATPYYLFGYDWANSEVAQCTPCPAGTAKATSGNLGCTACPVDTYSPAGATACTACPAGSDTGGASSQSTCTCADGLVFTADGRCDWAPSAWAGADPTGYAYQSVERLYPPAALRGAGFASVDDVSPDVHVMASDEENANDLIEVDSNLVSYAPATFYCYEPAGNVVTCDSCTGRCAAPNTVLENRNLDNDIIWRPTNIVNDANVVLSIDPLRPIVAVLYGSHGAHTNGNIYDASDIKVEKADAANGPWEFVKQFDISQFHNTKQILKLQLDSNIAATYIRLTFTGGIHGITPRALGVYTNAENFYTNKYFLDSYAPGRYVVAYSSIDTDTAAGYTGFGPYNTLRHGDGIAAQHDGNWAPAQYAGGAYTGTADLTGTLSGEWLALELPVAVMPTKIVIATNGLDASTVAYAPHHFALYGYGAAGAWVKLHEEVLTAASYTHTLAQAGDSYALELSGVTACYHVLALVVPTVGASADALSFGELQIFGREKYDACPAGLEADAQSVCQCPAGTAKVASGDVACSACPADTYSLAGATACTACPAGSDTGGGSSQSACTCTDGLVFTADGRCDWAPSAWAGADPTGYAYQSVERLYPPAALRGASPGFASADDASPDVYTFGRDAIENIFVETKTNVSGWRLVRYLPPTASAWHPATDDLAGTDVYGTANDNSNAWSVEFGTFDDFVIGTCGLQHWVWVEKDELIGEHYTPTSTKRNVKKSSYSDVPYEAGWWNRGDPNQSYDPVIYDRDHYETGKQILYMDDSKNVNFDIVSTDTGMCVWVRDSNQNSEIADATYGFGRYVVAYSSIDTLPGSGFTGFGPYNTLRHGDGVTAQHDANWAPAQYAGGAYTGTADLTGTLSGEWLALEFPVALKPTRVVIATNGLDPATVAYAPHHFALYGYGAAGAWVKLHEEVLTPASYSHTLTQAGDSYALELSGVTACYHIFALVVPTVGASADALSFGELQIFGREKYDACPAGLEADAQSVCQAVEASVSPYAVSFAVSLPMTEAEFDAAAQTAYKASVATAASVEASAVSIDSITALARRRRLLSAGIEVATSVQATSSAAASTISATITIEALNTQLDAAGLPQASMVSAPVVAQNTCLLAGFHISGTGLVAATV